MFLLCAITLCVVSLSVSEDCVIDNRSRENIWEKKLHKDVSCNYTNYHIHPYKNNSKTANIEVRFILKAFEFDDTEETISLFSWMILSWKDSSATWNPSEYDGIEKFHMRMLDIWNPALQIFNAEGDDTTTFFSLFSTECEVSYSGTIVCVPRPEHKATCSTKLTNWPYDIQNCTLYLGEKRQFWIIANYTFDPERGVSTMGAEYGSGWNIIEMTHGKGSNDILFISFVLERQAESLAAVLVIPSIVITLLTVFSSLLDVKNYVRLSLVTMSLYIHFVFLQEINEVIPKHSVDTPVFLLFIRGSLLVTALSVILTFTLSCFRKKSVLPPKWIIFVNDCVLNTKANYLIYPRWETEECATISEELNERNKAAKDWTEFANVVNSFSFFVIVIIYITLFLTSMPRPPPQSY